MFNITYDLTSGNSYKLQEKTGLSSNLQLVSFYGGRIQPRQIEALFYMAADMQHGEAGL